MSRARPRADIAAESGVNCSSERVRLIVTRWASSPRTSQLAELRKRFDPVLYPRPKGAERLEIIQKASAAARKLAELLPDIDGLEDKRVQRIETELGALRQELDALATSLKSSLDKPGKKKPPRLKVAAPV